MKKMITKLIHKVKKIKVKVMIKASLAGAAAAYCMLPTTVFASGAVTSKINNITDLVSGIITAAGTIVLFWGVFDFAMAYQQHDSSQQTQSLKKVVAGIIMAVAPTIVNLLK